MLLLYREPKYAKRHISCFCYRGYTVQRQNHSLLILNSEQRYRVLFKSSLDVLYNSNVPLLEIHSEKPYRGRDVQNQG